VPFLLFVLLVQTRTGMDFLARGVERVTARGRAVFRALFWDGGGGSGSGGGRRRGGAEHIAMTPPPPPPPLMRPENGAVAGPAVRKEAEAVGTSGPRRKKRRFSKRLTDSHHLEANIQAGYGPKKKSWLWWRRAPPNTTDGVV
jgi:hypothetical protein